MKFDEEFRVAENLATVWEFFEQPLRVAECIPGVKKAEKLDDGDVAVVVTQRLGPMTATFDAKVHITDQVHQERIEFTSTGKAVRGAAGNFRASNAVTLRPEGAQTHVTVSGDVALAGALGSVGQKFIAKQAAKVTAQFTENLERVLSGKPAEEKQAQPRRSAEKTTLADTDTRAGRPQPTTVTPPPGGDPWPKISAALSAMSVIIGLVILSQL